MVHQTPGCGDQHINTSIDLAVLIAKRNSTDEQCHVEFLVCAIFLEVLGDLGSQFTCRLQNQRARHTRLCAALRELVKHRQHERGRFARPGLRDAGNITAADHSGDGLCLNRGGLGIAGGFDRLKNTWVEAKFIKYHIWICSGRHPGDPDLCCVICRSDRIVL